MASNRGDVDMYELLRPLARILLRRGITAHQFSRWAGAAFVQAAADLLAEQGNPASYSRISTLTGLHRHTVRDLQAGVLRGESGPAGEKEYQRNRLARVLTGWFEDPVFTDRDGNPRRLPFDGPSPSFVELVRAYSGDIYPRIILDELTRVGAASVEQDGTVRAVSRRYTVGGADESAVHHAAIVAADVIGTLEHNMTAAPADRRFEDASISVDLDPRYIPLMRRMLETRGAAFLDDIEGWLGEKERKQTAGLAGQPAMRASVRVVMVVEPAGSGSGEEPAKPKDLDRSGE